MIDFEPLWKTMKDKKISQYQLINEYGISRGTMDSLRKNKNITLNTLNDFLRILECDITDVIRYVPDDPEELKKVGAPEKSEK